MAKKKVTAAVDPANQVETAKVAEPATVPEKVSTKDALYAELSELVTKYNESAEFSEFKAMKKIDEKITETLQKYTAECETECFNVLSKAENPMLEAAKVLVFPTVRVRDEKQEGGGTKRVISPASRKIDPLRLHKRVDGGIGADKLWWSLVERLNMLFTAAVATELEAVNTSKEKLDLTKIRDTAAMSEEAKKVQMKSEDAPCNDDIMLADIQSTIDAMLGEGDTGARRMVVYLRNQHTRGSKDSMTVVCSNAKTMRQYLLDVCHAAITGDDFVLDYKQAK